MFVYEGWLPAIEAIIMMKNDVRNIVLTKMDKVYKCRECYSWYCAYYKSPCFCPMCDYLRIERVTASLLSIEAQFRYLSR